MAEIQSAIDEERFEELRESFWSRYVPTDEATRREQKQKWLQARGE
jgi:queuine/archaeosine tRNA-ribosyltransferase